jgi:8-oxo-dGTP pyrophosphatase MutT (NUDIX family)
MSNREQLLAGCVIPDEIGRVLLLRNIEFGWWEVPGGKVEENESAEAAAVRELGEELNVAVELGPHLRRLEYDFGERHYYHDLFRATITDQPRRLLPAEPHKHDQAGYIRLGSWGIGAIMLSPAAERLSKLLRDGEIRLQ